MECDYITPKGHTLNIDWTISLKIKIHFISRINFPHNILPSLVLSNALALKLRHGHGHAGHGGPLFFLSGQAPKARPAQCPMLTCTSRSCKCTSPTWPVTVPSKCTRSFLKVATASAMVRPQAPRCEGNAAVHIVFHTCGIFGQGNYHVASKLSDKLLVSVMNGFLYIRATSHMRLKARDQYTSTLSLMEKAVLVQVHFTLRLRDQRSM